MLNSNNDITKDNRHIVVIAHNLRSTHNVGSLLRTAEGLGVETVYLTGYTPYPQTKNDDRLPHIATKVHAQISKTALGAEDTQSWEHAESIDGLVNNLKQDGYVVAALEQSELSIPLYSYKAPHKIALILGREVDGIEPEVLATTNIHLEIPMFGSKESFNVVQAAAMALYQLRFSE